MSRVLGFSYLANPVEAVALTELIFNLLCTPLGLFQTAHGIGMLPVTEIDDTQVEVGAVQILQ